MFLIQANSLCCHTLKFLLIPWMYSGYKEVITVTVKKTLWYFLSTSIMREKYVQILSQIFELSHSLFKVK